MFINIDSKNIKKTRQQNFAVLSHVVGTHRKWSRGKRLEQVTRFATLGPSGRVVRFVNTFHTHPCLRFQKPIARSPNPPGNSAASSIQDEQNPKPGSPDTKIAVYAAPYHEPSCECSSCLKAKADAGFMHMRSFLSISQPLVRGNSDPFAASPVPITADVNDYLTLGSQFYVFWTWPVYASPLFRSRAQGDWEEAVQNSFRSPSEMHAMLAGGAYVRADRSLGGADKYVVRATSHKTQAMRKLREGLISKDLKGSAVLLWTVLRLLALEIYDGNFEAAMFHHRAAKQIIRYHKFPDWHHDSHLIFFAAETLVCTALLQKPAPMERQWGAGPPPEEPNICEIGDKAIDSAAEYDTIHQAVSSELRQTFLDIRKVSRCMQNLGNIKDEEQKFHIVTYLDTRAAILKARILTLWVDFNTAHRGASLSSTDIMFSACSMAALVFTSFIFMFAAKKPGKPPPSPIESQEPAASSVLHKAFSMLYRDLAQLVKMWRMSAQTIDSEAVLWLYFISTLVGGGCPSWTERVNEWSSRCDVLEKLGINTSEDAKAVLKHFLFHEALMDDYLDELMMAKGRKGRKGGEVGRRKFAFQQLNVHLAA